MISLSNWPVGFCESVDVHREKIQVCHLLEEVGGGRRGGDGDAHGVGEFGGFFGCA